LARPHQGPALAAVPEDCRLGEHGQEDRVGGGGDGRRIAVGESAERCGENPTGVLSGGREEHGVFRGGGGAVLGSDDIIGQSVGRFR